MPEDGPPAEGDYFTVIVNVKDSVGNPVPGETVLLKDLGPPIFPAPGSSDQQGLTSSEGCLVRKQ